MAVVRAECPRCKNKWKTTTAHKETACPDCGLVCPVPKPGVGGANGSPLVARPSDYKSVVWAAQILGGIAWVQSLILILACIVWLANTDPSPVSFMVATLGIILSVAAGVVQHASAQGLLMLREIAINSRH